jgi:predicted transcriptional regulator
VTTDRTTAVLSIRPVYVDRILDGSKTIEFRRRPLPVEVEQMLIWKTGPDGGVVARVAIEGHATLTAEAWATARGRGTETVDLAAYAGGWDAPVTGIYLGKVDRFQQANRLGFPGGPQSWRYAPADWRTVLEVAW